ncbi:site-2 protease family protein [Ureibacillus aquaedulcis]|uniref:Stage IV sporulation protein FB n=1 Tax=Ureibacillus aquaedulcis TaxID=3058421 RepID=A0ABT8GT12_9BACL|nr:site-2 protease family protein [Ureibacillus sp. BA0131]MDN4494545.1 stage IV sporulation protein FB [Ureibacillus sp. BA0131]
MDERAYAIMMRMTIHPLFLPILFSIVLYGNISYYALILSSLIIHEVGHILAAYFCKVKVERCVIMPYGGEIQLKGGNSIAPKKQLIIALGGPIATICCMAATPFLDPLIADPLLKIQIILLAVNIIPIWPLDGGRIIMSLIHIFYPRIRVVELYLAISLVLITGTVLITFILLPKSSFLLVLSIFLFIQIVNEWRYRKYRLAFEKHVIKRLT